MQDWLKESIESLQLESPGTHKKNLSDKAKVMLDNLKECIKYLDFLQNKILQSLPAITKTL